MRKITSVALKGDPKAISLIIAKEPEITAAVQRAQRLVEQGAEAGGARI